MALDALDILLVDDNPYMRRIVSAVLKGAGVKNVREVGDGSEALTQLRNWPADVAIVDFNMFPLDGVQFTKLIRNSPDSPNPFLPIIMMTGHSERSRVMEARDAGVTEFVVKPFTPKAFLGRIEAMVMRPRPFVRAGGYFGPCRRRAREASEGGPRRRATDVVMV
jgi:CheY-like chemotaxis protein